ncbi:MAG: thioredoxin domain-containing protein [Bacteroidales bacterium]|nr:thioredoxin domain-containing protein [Bacteroidales bacterium]
MKFFNKISVFYFTFLTVVIISCNNIDNKKPSHKKEEVIAILNGQNIFVSEIDSIIGLQIYEQRLNALKLFVSRKILENEAKKQKIPLRELVENQINKKCKRVTIEDFEKYISQLHISYIDTNNIKTYLLTINQKDRQVQYIDLLKQYYSIKIKLQPPFYNFTNTNEIISHKLTASKSRTEVVIVTDFTCPACQQAEQELKNLYEKYNNKVNFKFVYFSDYIDKSALACEAAAKQYKFRQMHDIIFEHTELLNQDSIYFYSSTVILMENNFSAILSNSLLIMLKCLNV